MYIYIATPSKTLYLDPILWRLNICYGDLMYYILWRSNIYHGDLKLWRIYTYIIET